ncbi:MAG: DNA repair protein RecO [Anaerovoracaceae bacterium]
MYVDSEGIIIKQTKSVNGRKMVTLFSKKYGKISAGTSINEKGKGKSSLAMKPFTYGRYNLYKNRDNFNVNGAETIKSYYRIGENIDKYMVCSYILELTDKLLGYSESNPRLFNLLLDFFEEIEKREKKYMTLVLAYEVKCLKELGVLPEIHFCTKCNSKDELNYFSVKDGGVLCSKCIKDEANSRQETLIFPIKFGIISILEFFIKNPLSSLKKLTLEDSSLLEIRAIIKEYMMYHLDVYNLKSESFLTFD